MRSFRRACSIASKTGCHNELQLKDIQYIHEQRPINLIKEKSCYLVVATRSVIRTSAQGFWDVCSEVQVQRQSFIPVFTESSPWLLRAWPEIILVFTLLWCKRATFKWTDLNVECWREDKNPSMDCIQNMHLELVIANRYGWVWESSVNFAVSSLHCIFSKFHTAWRVNGEWRHWLATGESVSSMQTECGSLLNT